MPAPIPLSRQRPDLAPGVLLRAGLAFVYAYASIACIIDPDRFRRFMPEVFPAGFTDRVFLPSFSAFEAVLVVLLVTGRRLFAAAVLAALIQVAIVVANPDAFDVLFRNVAVTFAALALALHARRGEGGPVLALRTRKAAPGTAATPRAPVSEAVR